MPVPRHHKPVPKNIQNDPVARKQWHDYWTAVYSWWSAEQADLERRRKDHPGASVRYRDPSNQYNEWPNVQDRGSDE